MKTVSAGLLAILATRQFVQAYLYTFTLIDGTVLRYTSGDKDIVFGGNTYSSGGNSNSGPGPWFNTVGDDIQLSWKLGVEVDTMQLGVLAGSATFGGVPLLTAIKLGVFDGATMQMDIAIMATYGDTSQGVIPAAFYGRLGPADVGRTGATFTINSHLVLLNQNFPRNLCQPGCMNTLYDTACTLHKADFAVTGAAASGSTNILINTSSLGNATGYFDLGSIIFTSGVNTGFSRSIKAYTHGSPSTITLYAPMPSPPAASDTFTIYPGCDKLQATCSGKFSNLANFRGMPYVPQPETAL